MDGIYHKTTYDLYSLIELLASVGFKDIRKYDRFKTDHARHDDHSAAMIEGNLISLNIQCYAWVDDNRKAFEEYLKACKEADVNNIQKTRYWCVCSTRSKSLPGASGSYFWISLMA